MKQVDTERKRAKRLMERMEQIQSEEREKVKAGKKPFYMKNSIKKEIELEER